MTAGGSLGFGTRDSGRVLGGCVEFALSGPPERGDVATCVAGGVSSVSHTCPTWRVCPTQRVPHSPLSQELQQHLQVIGAVNDSLPLALIYNLLSYFLE